MKKWLKRIGLGALALLVLVIGAGAVHEAIESGKGPRDHPPPGKMVDVEGRRLQLDCRGTGGPVVVFESGVDTLGSLSWSPVQDSIAKMTRACSYSRPGVMWSDPHESPELARMFAHDLHAALHAAGETGPYVMVGHSMGGPYIMTYTKYFPAEVVGLVLVDASHPDQWARMPKMNPAKMLPMLRLLDAMSWAGAVRLMFRGQKVEQLSAAENGAIAAYVSKGFHTALLEVENVEQTFAEARSLRSLGDRPLYVLTSMKPLPPEALAQLGMTEEEGRQAKEGWKALHEELAALSSHSRHALVPDASHYIQVDQPQQVVDAVLWVVEEVRQAPRQTRAAVLKHSGVKRSESKEPHLKAMTETIIDGMLRNWRRRGNEHA